MIAAADADTGRSRLRSAAVIRLLLHNALRVDETLGADIADLGTDRGHQVLRAREGQPAGQGRADSLGPWPRCTSTWKTGPP